MRTNNCFLFIIIIYILLNLLIIFSSINKVKIQDNFFRLHIIANSNSKEDQDLKLNVAKAISDYLNKLYNHGDFSTKIIAKENIIKNINKLLQIANSTIKQKGYSYEVYANIGKMKYDNKKTSSIDMSKGTYDSVKIIIGNGNGQNFWSIIYPYSYVGSYEFKDKSMGKNFIIDTSDILNQENITYEFKIINWFKKIF